MEDTNTENLLRKTISDGVHFTVIQDTKFKQNQLVVSFFLPLSQKTASAYALLPLVLKRGCSELPDMTALNRRLKGLYGAHLDGSVVKRGETQIVTLYCESLGDAYAFGGEQVLLECAGLLNAVIFDPALENNCFKAKDVEIERRNLIDQIDSILNEKRSYATMRLKEEMCANEAYGISELGRREDAEAVTPEALFEAWGQMLKTARAEIFLVGSGDAAPIEKLFSDSFARVGRDAVEQVQTVVIKEPGEAKTVIERLPVTQAKLVMGLRAGMASPENTDAMQLAVAILGGTPHSKLFANVREKMSLCYYCLSYFERQKGLVFIDSGIEEQNYEQARGEILHQLEELKAGSFSDDDICFAKLSLQNSFTQVTDSLDALAVYYLSQSISGAIRTPAESAAGIMGVTREEIIDAAQKIALDTVYLLAGEKEGA